MAKTCIRCKTSTGFPTRLWKNGSSGALIWNVAPYVVIRGQATNANETVSYGLAGATCVCVCVWDYTHCKANMLHYFVIWITDLLLVLWRITRSQTFLVFPQQHCTVVVVISAIVEPSCPLPDACCRKAQPPRSTTAGSGQSTSDWFGSRLPADVEVEEPETSENPTQLFVIHNIVWRRRQLLAVIKRIIWYVLYDII